MRGILRKPREPSVIGIMLFSTLVVLAAADPPIHVVAIGLLLFLLHLFSFDTGFNAARRRDAATLLIVALINILPYALIVLLREGMVYIFGIILALSLLLIATIAYWIWPKNPWSYIIGSIVPALPALSLVSVFHLGTKPIIAWLFYSVYIIAEAAYIESRLPFRNFNPWISTVLWMPAILIAYSYNPLLLLATIEPTLRFFYNSLKGPFKVAHDEIRRLGRRALLGTTLFTITTILILLVRQQ